MAAPRRLLDIGHENSQAVHLREMADDDGVATNPRYVALSHCWGRDPFLQTSAANAERHRSPGIDADALPRTFREAIDFTRKLGLRYIWIDSLCIIQDDTKDWQQESSRMAEIYQGAYLVLSASQASSAHDGLYSDTASSPLYEPHIVTLEAGQVAFRRAYAHMPSPIQNQLQQTPDLPTLTRGWIYQERLLAARVLHFGPHELHWECMVDSKCQCSSDLGSSDDSNKPLSQPISAKHTLGCDHWKSLDAHSLNTAWHNLVEIYTSLSLTYPKDIFPALSGVAKTFQSVKQSRYHAGLWESSLIRDLLWHSNPPPTKPDSTLQHWHQRPSWRAPSWSWAAVNGPVEYINTHNGLDPFCSVVSCEVGLAGSDETGELTSGSMTLTGYAVETDVTLRTPESGRENTNYRPWNLLRVEILDEHVANVWADYNCALQDDLPPSVVCFLLGECKPSGALIMLALKGIDSGTVTEDIVYQRIGIIQVAKLPGRQGSLEYWRRAFSPKVHTVTII